MAVSKRKRPPKHNKLTPNFGEDSAKRIGTVDWEKGERSRARRPMRNPDWKPRRRSKVSASIQLELPKEHSSELKVRLTVVSTHHARKAPMRFYKKTWPFREVDGPLELGEIVIGDYVVIARIRGHRPIASLAAVKHSGVAMTISPPLIPVRHRKQELELLRVGESHPYVEDTRAFLERFGYLIPDSCDCDAKRICEHLEQALRLYQHTNNLKNSGSITIETLVLMLHPRCGVPDFEAGELGYVVQHMDSVAAETGSEEAVSGPGGTTKEDPIVFTPSHWDSFALTYRRLDGTSDISNEWSVIRNAMQHWADVSPLSFSEVSSAPSHLEFDFRRPSETTYPFDEGGTKSRNVLAQGFFPSNGLIEFDEHEDWGDISLEAVATHEVGHALGLRHSSVESACMYATYNSDQKRLKEVDVRGIKSLYAPIVRRNGPFIAYPLFAFNTTKGTDTITIDMGTTQDFVAWGVITMIDALIDKDRDNMCYIDIFEVDGNRTSWRAAGGDHFGSMTSPSNVHEGAYIGRGRTVMFRLVAGHVSDLEVSGYAIILILN